jgi:hypothetical protein
MDRVIFECVHNRQIGRLCSSPASGLLNRLVAFARKPAGADQATVVVDAGAVATRGTIRPSKRL